jgi:hypothetical protein
MRQLRSAYQCWFRPPSKPRIRSYIAALGGQIEVRAVFPDEVITLLGDGKVTETVKSKSSAFTASAR